jgi:hypothetical protein
VSLALAWCLRITAYLLVLRRLELLLEGLRPICSARGLLASKFPNTDVGSAFVFNALLISWTDGGLFAALGLENAVSG